MSTNNVGSSSESGEDNERVIIKSSKKKKNRCLSESTEEVPDEIQNKATPENNVENRTQRSSERLRQRSQKIYTLPNRRTVLDDIPLKDVKYEDRNLRPRRLANDFVTSLNRYAMDKISTFESDESQMSDFIDDSEILRHKKPHRKRKRIKKKTLSEGENDSERKTRKLREQRKRKGYELSSDEEERMEHEEGVGNKFSHTNHNQRTRKYKKGKQNGITIKLDRSSSGEESSIDVKSKKIRGFCGKYFLSDSDERKSSSSEDKDSEDIKLPKSEGHSTSNKIDSPDSDEEPNRKLLKRTKSAKKEKESTLLAKLVAKRKLNKIKQENNQKDTDTNVLQAETHDNIQTVSSDDTEEIQDDNILNLTDVSQEGESDREFLDDSYYSDVVMENFEHDVQNADDAVHNNALKVKEKKQKGFQRIHVNDESDESDAETIIESVTLDVCKAIQENDIESVKYVLEKTPNIVHELALKRRTLLHYAVISNSAEITKLLLHANADTFSQDSNFLPPIAYALLADHIDCLKLLLECTNLEKFNEICKHTFKFNMLHFILYGMTKFPDLTGEVADDSRLVKNMEILFEFDESLFLKLMREKDSQSFTPLVAGIVTGNSQCVEYMINNGALVDDFQRPQGGNLLHFAIDCSMKMEQVKRALCLKVLLQTSLKHKVNCCDNSGLTPLMYAAQCGNHDCVLALLEAGASVLCKDKHGTTSLHLAAASGDTQSVKLLLQYGHQVDCLDSWGWPPLLYANFAAQESCVISLMEPNPKQIFVLGDLLNRGKSAAAKERNFKVVKDVLIALANQDAYYRVFNDFIRRNPNFLDEYDRGLLHNTWRALLDYDNKLRWFKSKLASKRWRCYDVPLEVDREAVFECAMKKLGHFNGEKFRDCRLEVTFKNEEGICTGPKREFFVNICKDIVDERHKLFHLTDDNQYSFLPNSYFAEITKEQVGGKIDEKIKHSSLSSATMKSSAYFTAHSNVSTVSNESRDGVGDCCGSSSIMTHLDDKDLTQERSSQSISRNPSGDLNTVEEIEDAIIAELDENTFSSLNSSRNVNSNDESNTTLQHATMDPVNSSTFTSEEEIEDTIIAELDIKNIDSHVKDNPEDAETFATCIDSKQKMNLSQLTFLGRIIGVAICEGFFINLNLCKPIVKQILGLELNHPDDLSSFDYELHKNYVTFILESEDVESLELPCTLDVLNPWNERLTALTLFPEQRNEEFLNDRNKAEYVNLISHHKLTVLIKKELDALCQGLFEVIPKSLFSLFTADEFSLLINGIGKIDVKDWQKNTQYTPPDAEITRREINWFWKVVNELTEDEKALLLKFSTGSPCLPAGGFSQLQGLGGLTMFHISTNSEWNKIPTASTCFNLLKLPRYENIKDLKDKLLIAIRHGTESFSFS